MIDASPVTAPDMREVLDLQSVYARMDRWTLSEVAKVVCGGFGICINLTKDQYAALLVVHQALEVGSAVHCQERNEINNHKKENRD